MVKEHLERGAPFYLTKNSIMITSKAQAEVRKKEIENEIASNLDKDSKALLDEYTRIVIKWDRIEDVDIPPSVWND